MTDHGRPKPSDELRQVASRRPHLMDHLKKFKQITGEFPKFIEAADEEYESHRPNVLYPVGGPIFCHIYGDVGQDMKYYAIEPELADEEKAVFENVRDRLLERSVNKPAPTSETEYDDRIEELLQETTTIKSGASDESGVLSRFSDITNIGKVEVNEQTYENILYRLNRDIV
jgi:flagellar protein FlaI